MDILLGVYALAKGMFDLHDQIEKNEEAWDFLFQRIKVITGALEKIEEADKADAAAAAEKKDTKDDEEDVPDGLGSGVDDEAHKNQRRRSPPSRIEAMKDGLANLHATLESANQLLVDHNKMKWWELILKGSTIAEKFKEIHDRLSVNQQDLTLPCEVVDSHDVNVLLSVAKDNHEALVKMFEAEQKENELLRQKLEDRDRSIAEELKAIKAMLAPVQGSAVGAAKRAAARKAGGDITTEGSVRGENGSLMKQVLKYPWQVLWCDLEFEYTRNGKEKRQLGRGGFGNVFAAKYNGHRVAVKVFSRNDITSILGAFKQEVAICTRLHHPNMIRFHGATIKNLRDPDDDTEYSIVMQRGRLSLRDALALDHDEAYYCVNSSNADGGNEDEEENDGDATPSSNSRNDQDSKTLVPGYFLGGFVQKLHLLKELAGGLMYLHQSSPPIIHRDIKCENVMLDENDRPLFIDFGVAEAKVTAIASLSSTFGKQPSKAPFGYSEHYAAPEILNAAASAASQTSSSNNLKSSISGPTPTPRSRSGVFSALALENPAQDIYSFGCLMFEVLAGGNARCWRSGEDVMKTVARNVKVHERFTLPHHSKLCVDLEHIVDSRTTQDRAKLLETATTKLVRDVQCLVHQCTRYNTVERPTATTVFTQLHMILQRRCTAPPAPFGDGDRALMPGLWPHSTSRPPSATRTTSLSSTLRTFDEGDLASFTPTIGTPMPSLTKRRQQLHLVLDPAGLKWSQPTPPRSAASGHRPPLGMVRSARRSTGLVTPKVLPPASALEGGEEVVLGDLTVSDPEAATTAPPNTVQAEDERNDGTINDDRHNALTNGNAVEEDDTNWLELAGTLGNATLNLSSPSSGIGGGGGGGNDVLNTTTTTPSAMKRVSTKRDVAVINGQKYTKQDCYIKALEQEPENSSIWRNLAFTMTQGAHDTVTLPNNLVSPSSTKASTTKDNDTTATTTFSQTSVTQLSQIDCYAHALEHDRYDVFTWNNLGVALKNHATIHTVHIGRGEGEQQVCYDAKQCFAEAVTLDPQHKDSWHNLGLLLMQLEESEQGEKEASANKQSPAGSTATINGKAYSYLDCFVELLGIDDTFSPMAWRAGAASLSNKAPAGGGGPHTKVKPNPAGPAPTISIGGKVYTRTACLAKAASLDPTNPTIWEELGHSLGAAPSPSTKAKPATGKSPSPPKSKHGCGNDVIPAVVVDGQRFTKIDCYVASLNCMPEHDVHRPSNLWAEIGFLMPDETADTETGSSKPSVVVCGMRYTKTDCLAKSV